MDAFAPVDIFVAKDVLCPEPGYSLIIAWLWLDFACFLFICFKYIFGKSSILDKQF